MRTTTVEIISVRKLSGFKGEKESWAGWGTQTQVEDGFISSKMSFRFSAVLGKKASKSGLFGSRVRALHIQSHDLVRYIYGEGDMIYNDGSLATVVRTACVDSTTGYEGCAK